ncbi:MAG: class I SAM-dependent methyltransferase [bacterium]
MPVSFVADFGHTAADYAAHRAGFPASFFDRLAGWGLGRPGQTLCDLGTGTGALARDFAARGCQVTGVDRAPAMLSEADRLAKDSGLAIRWVAGAAEATGLPDKAFQIVTAGQCWHWFDAVAAGAEVRRLLVPGGWIVIAHYSWIPLPGNCASETETLIVKHNPAWNLGGDDGIHAQELTDLALAGFEELESFSFDVPQAYTHEGWRGRIRASAGIAGSLATEAVAAFDGEHAVMLRAQFPDDPLIIPHRVWAVLGRAPQ